MQKSTLFPHLPMGTSAAFKKSDIVIDGMKVKFDKVAMLVPTELTMKDGATVATSMSIQYARAFDSMIFDETKLLEIEYTSPGNETIGMIVARNFNGLPAEEMAKAVNFHQEKLGLGDQILEEGQTITIWIYMGLSGTVIVRPLEKLTQEKVEGMFRNLYEVIYESKKAALGRLKNILWWPEKETGDPTSYLNYSLWGVFKALVAVVKDQLLKPEKYIFEFLIAMVETDVKKWLFGLGKEKFEIKPQKGFDFVQNLEFSLSRFYQKIPELAKAAGLEFQHKMDQLEGNYQAIDETEMGFRKSMEEMDRVFRDSFTIEVELLARFFNNVYTGAKIWFRINGESDKVEYIGLTGVPEEKRKLLNAEYNRLANELKWPYMQFYKMGLPVHVSRNDRKWGAPILKGILEWSAAGVLITEQGQMAGFLRNENSIKTESGKWYMYDYPLNVKDGKGYMQVKYRVPFPYRFTNN